MKNFLFILACLGLIPVFAFACVLGAISGIVLVAAYIITGLFGLAGEVYDWGKKIINKLFP